MQLGFYSSNSKLRRQVREYRESARYLAILEEMEEMENPTEPWSISSDTMVQYKA